VNQHTYDLERFIQAQADVYQDVIAELKAGKKASHWMWFIFPQLAALGRSDTARFYGLTDLQHARDYWAHPVLGVRLEVCCALLLDDMPSGTAHEIFGSPDDLKLRSCMTLFEVAAPQTPIFVGVLERFYQGKRDELTLRHLSSD
jgi:uncharacterized protein (DUF1810 family)